MIRSESPNNHYTKVKHFHDRDATNYMDTRYGTQNILQLGYVVRRQIAVRMIDEVHGSILDAGCGPGPFGDMLNKETRIVFFTDISPGMLLEAKRAAPSVNRSSHYFASNLCNLPVRAGAFDGVLCIGVIGYIPDAQEAVDELSRVQRRGGICVIQSSNPLSIKEVLYERFLPSLKRRLGIIRIAGLGIDFPLRSFSMGQLEKMITKAGFRVVDRAYYDFHLPFLERLSMGIAVWTAMRLQRFSRNCLFSCLAGGYLLKIQKV